MLFRVCAYYNICGFFTLAILRYYLTIVCDDSRGNSVPRKHRRRFTILDTRNTKNWCSRERIISVFRRRRNAYSPSAISRRSNGLAYKSIRPYSCRGSRITLNIASQLTAADHWRVIARARQQLRLPPAWADIAVPSFIAFRHQDIRGGVAFNAHYIRHCAGVSCNRGISNRHCDDSFRRSRRHVRPFNKDNSYFFV